jgi:hypothetical protein
LVLRQDLIWHHAGVPMIVDRMAVIIAEIVVADALMVLAEEETTDAIEEVEVGKETLGGVRNETKNY